MTPDQTWQEEDKLVETISPSFLDRQQLGKFPRPERALLEFIDNILDARTASMIIAKVGLSKELITIEDQGGSGMNRQELIDHWLRWGGSSKDGISSQLFGAKGFIGRDGLGAKAAAESLAGGGYEMTYIKVGDKTEYRLVSSDTSPRTNLRQYRHFRKEYTRSQPGRVKMVIEKPKHHFNQNFLSTYFGKMYSAAIDVTYGQKVMTIYLNDKEVPAVLPNYAEAPEVTRISLSNGANLICEIGKKDERKKSDFRPGLSIYVLGRLIKEGYFGTDKGWEDLPGLQSLVGRVMIDSGNVAFSLIKDDFIVNNNWLAIAAELDKVLGKYVARAQKEAEFQKMPKAVRQVIEMVDKFVRTIAPAPEDRTYGIRKPERQEITQGHHKGRGDGTQIHIPRTPAQEGYVGSRERLGRSYFIETRSEKMGRTRYLVRPVIQDQIPIGYELILGSEHPGYRLGANDSRLLSLHLFETYAMAIAETKVKNREISPEEEKATAAEYTALFLDQAEKKGAFKKSFFG